MLIFFFFFGDGLFKVAVVNFCNSFNNCKFSFCFVLFLFFFSVSFFLSLQFPEVLPSKGVARGTRSSLLGPLIMIRLYDFLVLKAFQTVHPKFYLFLELKRPYRICA